MSSGTVERLWYVAYGSNLSAARFRCYLEGGRPEGGRRQYAGCRDRSGPHAEAALLIPGGIYFAGASKAWGGGMAFFDPEAARLVAARAYLLTVGQFADVLAQEMRQRPGTDVDISPLIRARRHTLGPGRYQTLVRVGARSGLPMVTFTSDRPDRLALRAPTEPYLRTMAAGLRESHGWARERVEDYLTGVPGVDPAVATRAVGTVFGSLRSDPPAVRPVPRRRVEAPVARG